MMTLAVRWTESAAYLETSEGEQLSSTRDSSVGKALERIAQGFNLAAQYKSERDEFENEVIRLRECVGELEEALSVIAGEPRQDDAYVGMDSKQIARAALAKASK